MFSKPSLMTRVAVAKLVAFVLTGATVLLLPGLFEPITWLERLGFVLWYTTIGAVVGLLGVMSFHPLLGISLPWWFRGAWVGGWMNAILLIFTWDLIQRYVDWFFGAGSVLASPWWLIAEGIFMGALLDWLATRFGGEGPDCVLADANR